MTDSERTSTASEYEYEMTAGREEIADVLEGVVDGILAGSIKLGTESDEVSVDIPDDLSLEIEFEDEGDELSLELELEWAASSDATSTPSIGEPSADVPEDPALASAADGSESLARFEVFQDRGGEWRWRLRHRNGNIIAISGEGYTRKHNAQKGIRSVVENSPEAEITEASTD